ncbi:MAG: bifunctional diaminohydroxyphosphoribosylaminopyrimidine deaminase/5-amino-6-(5-phosphoribosylamino)uracil reductase RibD [Pigmentiphaga sp.]
MTLVVPEQPQDAGWMRRALALAGQSLFITTPNPRVGCVIVRHEQVIAEGATAAAGGPHAEAAALAQLRARGETAAGATVYVTLEPCSHTGRTPPCVDALIAARPARVVMAMGDPNPLVNGQGIQRLRQAGIAVTVNVELEAALDLNPGFVSRMVHAKPWVWAKMAASLDGRSSLPNGVSQWITAEPARQDGHVWRARSCAILSGIGTVLADDPQLNVRGVDTPRQPWKIIIDADLRLPRTARLIDGARVIVFHASRQTDRIHDLQSVGVECVALPDAHGKVDIPALLRWLAEAGVNELHVEAGERLTGALIEAGAVDELLCYVAPMLLGEGRGIARLPVNTSLDQALRYQFIDVSMVGPDVRLRARDAARFADLLERVRLAPVLGADVPH